MTIDLNAVNAAIVGTRDGLEAAGFAIDCADHGGRLLLTIQAKENACEECLVPKSIFTSIVRDELTGAGLSIDAIDVVYPVEVDEDLS